MSTNIKKSSKCLNHSTICSPNSLISSSRKCLAKQKKTVSLVSSCLFLLCDSGHFQCLPIQKPAPAKRLGINLIDLDCTETHPRFEGRFAASIWIHSLPGTRASHLKKTYTISQDNMFWYTLWLGSRSIYIYIHKVNIVPYQYLNRPLSMKSWQPYTYHRKQNYSSTTNKHTYVTK